MCAARSDAADEVAIAPGACTNHHFIAVADARFRCAIGQFGSGVLRCKPSECERWRRYCGYSLPASADLNRAESMVLVNDANEWGATEVFAVRVHAVSSAGFAWSRAIRRPRSRFAVCADDSVYVTDGIVN